MVSVEILTRCSYETLTAKFVQVVKILLFTVVSNSYAKITFLPKRPRPANICEVGISFVFDDTQNFKFQMWPNKIALTRTPVKMLVLLRGDGG